MFTFPGRWCDPAPGLVCLFRLIFTVFRVLRAGIGLGAIASGALHITDRMLHSAAVALSRSVSEDLLKQGRIFPDIAQIRTVSENVAVAGRCRSID